MSNKKPKRVDSRRIDLKGKVFGEITVIELSDQRGASNTLLWLCQCSCGNKMYLYGYNLLHGTYNSCGCKHEERLMKGIKEHVEKDSVDGTRVTALTSKLHKGNKSGHKGVRFNSQRNKWTAHIGFKGKQINLGYHDTKESAIAARKAGEEKYHKPYLDKLEDK